MAKMKYYRFYLEDVTNGNVFTHIFSATSKAKAIELLNEYGSGIETISIKIVTPELMKRYGLTNESNSYNSPVETFEPSDDVSEIAEPETPAPAETPEQSDDVPEVSEPATPAPAETPEQSDDVPEVSEPATPVPDETPEQSDDVPEVSEPATPVPDETPE
ncbi:MAG: hypothetical protein K2L10_05480, partial [Ruminococcus sp.]|nr:hypothetical protein [Ruminococcus sp.]